MASVAALASYSGQPATGCGAPQLSLKHAHNCWGIAGIAGKMTQVIFLAVLLVAAVLWAMLRVLQIRIGFEPIFKVLASTVVMLPMVLMGGVVIFVLELGLCMLLLGVLKLTGLIPDLAVIPHQYEVFGLWLLFALALAIPGFHALRYIILIRDQ
jgi:hypothetical protein